MENEFIGSLWKRKIDANNDYNNPYNKVLILSASKNFYRSVLILNNEGVIIDMEEIAIEIHYEKIC